jgi:hypothetical protein
MIAKCVYDVKINLRHHISGPLARRRAEQPIARAFVEAREETVAGLLAALGVGDAAGDHSTPHQKKEGTP